MAERKRAHAARRRGATLILAAVLATGPLACSEDTTPLPTAARQLADAKVALAEGRYSKARDILEAVVPLDEAQGAERKAALALIEFAIWLQNTGEGLVDLAEVFATQREQVSAKLRLAAELPDDPSLEGGSFLNRQVWNLFKDDWERLDEVIGEFDELLSTWPAFHVHFPSVPLSVGSVPLFLLQGDMSAADFHFLRSWLHVFSFGLELVLAADIDFAIGTLIDYAETVPDCDRTDDLSRRRCWQALSAFALNNHPTMLAPEPSRGALFRGFARTSLSNFFGQTHAYFEALRAISEPTAEQSITWTDRPGGGGWVEWRHGRVPLTTRDIRALLRREIELTPPYGAVTTTIRFVVDGGTIDGMREAAGHVRDRAPVRIDANTSLVPTALTALEFLLQSDSVVTLLQVVAEGIDPGFAEDMVEVADEVRELYSDFDSADAVHNLFTFLFPRSLELNLLPLFEDPQFLRLFLPAAVTAPEPFDDEGNEVWTWQTEWECDESFVDLGFCSASAPLSDAAHFVGTPWEIAADGIKSPIAYTAFDDPSFGGTLSFDPWEVDPRFERGVTAPTQEHLNRLLQDLGFELLLRLGRLD